MTDLIALLRRRDDALCRDAADEIKRLREAGVGYSQQTVDALTLERDSLKAETARLRDIVQAISRALDDGTDARDILDENSPIRDAIRREAEDHG